MKHHWLHLRWAGAHGAAVRNSLGDNKMDNNLLGEETDRVQVVRSLLPRRTIRLPIGLATRVLSDTSDMYVREVPTCISTTLLGTLRLPFVGPTLDPLLPFLPLSVQTGLSNTVFLASLARTSIITALAGGCAVRALG